MNLKLLFALISIVEGEPEGKRTTYWRILETWINSDEVEINSLKVRPKPVPEDNTNEIG